MRWVYSLVLLMSLGIFAGGCSSSHVSYDQAKGVNFNNYKTYAWLPNERDTTKESVVASEITYQNLRSAANEEMAKRGFVLDTKNPDLLLREHTNFEKREELVSRPVYSSYNYYYPGFYPGPWYPYYYTGYYSMPYIGGYDIQAINYTEGTVVFDVIDRKRSQLVWRGWSEERLYDTDDVDHLYKHVDNIFKKYPVKENKKK